MRRTIGAAVVTLLVSSHGFFPIGDFIVVAQRGGRSTGSGASAPTALEPRIEGVWKIAEVIVTGPAPVTNDDPWPSLVIFTKKYFSFLSIDGIEPRPTHRTAAARGNPTDAEKLAMFEQWNAFTANAGTYDINGSTLGMRPIVGKTEFAMGYRITHEFKLEGDTLWLTTKPQRGGPPVETRRRLVRLE
jgi:hypothetical protein